MGRPASLLTIDEPDETALDDGSRPSWRRSRLLWPIAVLLVAALALALWQFTDGGPAPLSRRDVDQAVRAGLDQAQRQARNTPPDAATAYRRILPSLVTIVTTGAPKRGEAAGTGRSALGTGVVINSQGAVLTALHVVEAGGKIEVQFADGTRANATVDRRRPQSDIAVLAVDRLPEVVVPAVMGGGARVGDAVYPVGNPLGLQGSLSAGVVSALDRSIRSENGRTLRQLIQFDAAVNPGNSGGPLLNRDGQVVGIVTALANPSGQPYFVGIGFAVPITTAGGVAGGPSK
jgi:S1-C subfamily serine protease